jgi:head-tail adaptor
MPATTSGQMREKIRFQRRTSTPDGFGNNELGWTVLSGPFSARIRPINGKEEVLVGKLAGVQPFEIVVWSSNATRAVTTEDRAVNARTGQAYDITAIQNSDERNGFLSMLAKAGDAETT